MLGKRSSETRESPESVLIEGGGVMTLGVLEHKSQRMVQQSTSTRKKELTEPQEDENAS